MQITIERKQILQAILSDNQNAKERINAKTKVFAGDVVVLPVFLAELNEKPTPEKQRRTASKTTDDPQPTTLPTLTEEQIDVVRSWVLYKDDRLLAINKPPGLAVQGITFTCRGIVFPFLQ